MRSFINDLQSFYKSDIGLIVQDVISSRVREFWPDVHGQSLMGCGYAAPYVDMFHDDAPERSVLMMPGEQGACLWPANGKNAVFMSDELAMPIEPASVDRVLLVHHLESCVDVHASLQEVWRVLKGNGRVLVVVPNRMGAWAHADWSPFGRGMPYTLSQLCSVFQKMRFVHERHKGGLFMLPIPDSPVMMRGSRIMERMGRSVFPFVSGVHIVEFSKQIYARAGDSGTGSAVVTKAKAVLAGKPKPATQNFDISD